MKVCMQNQDCFSSSFDPHQEDWNIHFCGHHVPESEKSTVKSQFSYSLERSPFQKNDIFNICSNCRLKTLIRGNLQPNQVNVVGITAVFTCGLCPF